MSLLFRAPRKVRQSLGALLVSVLVAGMTSCSLFAGDTPVEEEPCLICGPFGYVVIDSEPAWSPDGSTIAYHHGSSVPGVSGIYLIDADGSNKRQFHAGAVGAPSWSPDGQWLAFHENAHIYKRHAVNDSLLRLTYEGRNFYPDWSPDGEWIAYDRSIADESGPGGVWIMKSNGSAKKPVFGGAFPTWHPDGQSLLAVIGTSASSIWKRFVKHYPFNDQPPETLNAVVGNDNRHPKYSPDGTKIVFWSQPDGAPGQIWMMDADGFNKLRLTYSGGWTANWSPDGEWIVFTESHETGRLWLMRPSGSDKRQLTFE